MKYSDHLVAQSMVIVSLDSIYRAIALRETRLHHSRVCVLVTLCACFEALTYNCPCSIRYTEHQGFGRQVFWNLHLLSPAKYNILIQYSETKGR